MALEGLGLDEDAAEAAVDLIRRTGATAIEFGFLHDDVPVDAAGWYACAQYRGAKIMVEDCRDPVTALEGLARRLLTGGRCTHCRGTITLSGPAVSGKCRWTRHGPRWVRGCSC